MSYIYNYIHHSPQPLVLHANSVWTISVGMTELDAKTNIELSIFRSFPVLLNLFSFSYLVKLNLPTYLSI